jgi:hypothetical protein
MIGAMVVISRPQLATSQETVLGFLRQTGGAIRRVRLRLSDASGVAVEERIWSSDNSDAPALAEEVAEHIASSATGLPDLEAIITISDSG